MAEYESREQCLIDTGVKFNFLNSDEINKIAAQLDEIRKEAGGDVSKMEIQTAKYLDALENELKHSSIDRIRSGFKLHSHKKFISMEGMEFNPKEATKRFISIFTGDNSIESFTNMFRARYDAMLTGGLKAGKVEAHAWSGELDKALRTAAHEYHTKGKFPPDTSPEVMELFKVYEQLQGRMLEDARAAGFNIRKLKSRLGRRRYSAEKMLNLGKEETIAAMHENVSVSRSFKDKDISFKKVNQVFEEIYDNITRNGTSISIDEMLKDRNYSRLLESRQLEFKDGAHEHAFMEKFGHSESIYEGMIQDLESLSKDLANVRFLGKGYASDEAGPFKELLDTFDASLKKAGLTAKEIKIAKGKVHKRWVNTSKINNSTPEGVVVDILNAVKATQTFKLGSSFFTSLYDLNSTAFHYALKSNMNQVAALGKTFSTLLETAKFSDEQRFRLAEHIGQQLQFVDPSITMGMNKGDFASKIGTYNKTVSSVLQAYGKGVGKLYKLSAVPWQVKHARFINGFMYSRLIGDMADLGSAKLSKKELFGLEKFNISAKDIDFLQKAKVKDAEFGIITQKEIMNIPLEQFHPKQKVALKMRAELADKISNYVNSMTLKGTPTPGIEEKISLRKDASINSEIIRAAMGVVMQFKETPMKIIHDMAGAAGDIYQLEGKQGLAKGTMQYLMHGFMTFYAIESLRRGVLNQRPIHEQISEGEIRDLFFDYINKISIAPILTDGVEATAKPYQGSFVRWALGPTYSTAIDIGRATEGGISSRSRRARAGRAIENILPTSWFAGKAAWRWGLKYNWLTGQPIKKQAVPSLQEQLE